jgi:hypothetical protein
VLLSLFCFARNPHNLDGGKWTLLDEFTEIESGKRNDRPELEKALAACKKHRAKLVIAKLGPHQSRARGRQGQRQEAWQLPAHRRRQAMPPQRVPKPCEEPLPRPRISQRALLPRRLTVAASRRRAASNGTQCRSIVLACDEGGGPDRVDRSRNRVRAIASMTSIASTPRAA